jgi:DNA-directed RNA polymerase specialized sigma24 family protein
VDDLAQDTVVARLTRAPAANVPERIWLRRVLINFQRTRFLRRRRRARWESVAEGRVATTPEAELAEREAAHGVVDLVISPPDDQREVVVLRYFARSGSNVGFVSS